MALTTTQNARIAGVCTCVPETRFDNVKDTREFTPDEVRKVTGMAGVKARRIADDRTCSSDLCVAASERLLDRLGWERESIDALILVTQSPDYLLPSTSCVIHHRLGLSTQCATFDVGLGCSGYPYGIWLGAMMLQGGGIRRVLVLHGETPARFADQSDRAVSLLFGDAGSATALEVDEAGQGVPWHYSLNTDGAGYETMIIRAGGFRNRFSDNPRDYSVHMNGALIFNFTLKRVPSLVSETLAHAQTDAGEIDYFIFHQANQFILKHLCKQLKVPAEKAPIILQEYGNTGGVSVPMVLTLGGLERPEDRALRLLLLGFGVGLSWGSALVEVDAGAILEHAEYRASEAPASDQGGMDDI